MPTFYLTQNGKKINAERDGAFLVNKKLGTFRVHPSAPKKRSARCTSCQNESKPVSLAMGYDGFKGESKREERNQVNDVRNELKWEMTAMRNDLVQSIERLRLNIDNNNKQATGESQKEIDDLRQQLTEAQEALKREDELCLGLQQEMHKKLKQMALPYVHKGDQVMLRDTDTQASSVQQATDRFKSENNVLIQQIEDMKYRSEMYAHEVRLEEEQKNLRALELEAKNKDLHAKLARLQMEYQSQAQRHNVIQNDFKSGINTMKNKLAQNKEEIIKCMSKMDRLLFEIEEEKSKGMWAKQRVIDNLQHQLDKVQDVLSLKEQIDLESIVQNEKLSENLKRKMKHEDLIRLALPETRSARRLDIDNVSKVLGTATMEIEQVLERISNVVKEEPIELKTKFPNSGMKQEICDCKPVNSNLVEISQPIDGFQWLFPGIPSTEMESDDGNNCEEWKRIKQRVDRLEKNDAQQRVAQSHNDIQSNLTSEMNTMDLGFEAAIDEEEEIKGLTPIKEVTEKKLRDAEALEAVEALGDDQSMLLAKALEGCEIKKGLLQVKNKHLSAKVDGMKNKLAQEKLAMQKARERLKAENVALNDQVEETKYKSKKLAEELKLEVREANLRALELETDNKGLEAKLMDLRIEYESPAQKLNDIHGSSNHALEIVDERDEHSAIQSAVNESVRKNEGTQGLMKEEPDEVPILNEEKPEKKEALKHERNVGHDEETEEMEYDQVEAEQEVEESEQEQ